MMSVSLLPLGSEPHVVENLSRNIADHGVFARLGDGKATHMERWIAILVELVPIGFALALAVAAAVDPVRELRRRLDVGHERRVPRRAQGSRA
jgi:hypothetical protein